MTINAAGYDLGIYVCPGTSNVQITGNTVTGAKDHGIFVQDASHITVDGNLVTGNGIPGSACPPSGTPPKGCVPEDKGIQMVGTSNSAITNNVVSYNSADGGIGIADDGPQNPGAPLGVSGSSLTDLRIISYPV
jgi:parallel beta-helix repeat protein